MEDVKQRARLALIRRVNNYHDRMLITEFVEDTVDELWNIFEDSIVFVPKGKISKADQTINCVGVKINGTETRTTKYIKS